MRLLLDQNLSRRLITRLAAEFPDMQHVALSHVVGRTDMVIWRHAARNDLIIVSKDNDFRQLAFLRGAPPKVIWLSVGNAGTDVIGELLQRNRSRIIAFAADPEESLLIIEP